MVAVFLTDPEHKTPVGRGRAVNDRAMWDMWRDEHDISEMNRVNFGSDLNADITFHKKIKFIITVRVAVHTIIMTVFQRIIIVINFKISGQHILSGLNVLADFFFHACSVLPKNRRWLVVNRCPISDI